MTDPIGGTGTGTGPERPLSSHAFHLNLPPHCIGPDGVPYVTRYAEKKGRAVLRLARSIVLTDWAFVVDQKSGDNNEMEGDDEEALGEGGEAQAPTLMQITKMCARLNTQLQGLESLKHGGLSQVETCEILLRVLNLLSATTVTFSDDSGGDGGKKTTRVRYDNVGTILGQDAEEVMADLDRTFPSSEDADDPIELERRLTDPFALPSPARESLLSVAIHILSKKGPLMSVSNVAIALPSSESGETGAAAATAGPGPTRMLIINWKALLRVLLRTAPFLDEHKAGLPPKDSSSRQATILKKTVELVRSSRRFFDQGISPTCNALTDVTARSIFDMVKNDLMYHTHSNSYFRAVIMLYLFSPSRCTSEYYREVLPTWLDCWNSVDRCPELDYLFLTMFCRARKYVKQYDWGQLRRRLVTQCGYWLQIPVGGSSSDNSFPRAAPPRGRGIPLRLKAFVGSGGSHQEGIDFVRKVSKLLVFCIGRDDCGNDSTKHAGSNDVEVLSSGTTDLLRFLAFVTPYFNPSNSGPWTYPLGVLLHYLSYDFCRRIGLAASVRSLALSNPVLAEEVKRSEPYTEHLEVPAREIAQILDSFVPLCQQALYSKSAHVSSAAESAMLYLAQVDPIRVCPPFLDLASRALDISSVTMSHQAPAALSALNRLVQPSLRRCPSVLLSRLPEILRLSLAGIDSNDQNKSIRTLIFYRSLTSWLPIGTESSWVQCNGSDGNEMDGTIRLGKDLMGTLSSFCDATEYEEAISSLPESSILKPSGFNVTTSGAESSEELKMQLEETALATSDWALEFLDRIYMLLHAAGEQEKVSKTSHGVASRHTSADASQTKNFSRVLRECLVQTFAAMDDETHKSSVRSVARFLLEETLPFAAKDASNLCQAASSSRFTSNSSGVDSSCTSPGLDALVPILTDDLKHHSNKTVIYRLRCLAGAVKYAGKGVLQHREAIVSAVEYALSHSDRHVYKTGCKLLRHTLASQCEAYPLSSDAKPRICDGNDGCIGRSSQLRGDALRWHVPDGEQIDFAVEILKKNVIQKLQGLATDKATSKNALDVSEWRRVLRVLRYSLRGCAGILLDSEEFAASSSLNTEKANMSHQRRSSSLVDEDDEFEAGPNEKANYFLVTSSSQESQAILMSLRMDLCVLMGSMLSLIASETSDEESTATSSQMLPSISSDVKVCKEIVSISLILLTRRSAPFRSVETKSICTAQKELIRDYALADEAEYIAVTLQKAGILGADGKVLYKDGEEGGKTVPRRLLVNRVYLFHQTIQRDASYAVPRRLRKMKDSSKILFTLDVVMDEVLSKVKALGERAESASAATALDAYECIIDGLCAASCLSNAVVRSHALGSVDYAFTRFGWTVRYRVPRLLSAISLQDDNYKGKFGLPSCVQLSKQTDASGKHKRFAEVLKGVCSIIALSRVMKEMLANERNRFVLAKSLCATQGVISLLPAEEMQKMVHYFQSIFSTFRSRFFLLPRVSAEDQSLHEGLLLFLLDVLSESEKAEDTNDNDDVQEVAEANQDNNKQANTSNMNWRNRLTTGWMVTSSIDERDLLDDDPRISSRLWTTCFHLIASEIGQPLQRVALGLFGRLITLALVEKDFFHLSAAGSNTAQMLKGTQQPDVSLLCQYLKEERFCAALGNALVYDHRVDSSVGGGHDAQWSAGVEDIIRDATANVAPKTLFPFQRTSRSSATFKVNHAQLVQAAMLLIGKDNALGSAAHLLLFATEIAAAPPSEDQKNQMCTAAEIFSGVCRGLLQCSSNAEELSNMWQSILLPFLSDVVPKIPISHSGAFYDALRYGIHHLPPNAFFDLTEWLINMVEDTLWRPIDAATKDKKEESNSTGVSQTPEGFTAQSKWLFLLSAVLVELDDETDLGSLNQLPWYTKSLIGDLSSEEATDADTTMLPVEDLRKSWKAVSSRLLPRLLLAVGHPYEKCRDHIASCLFRICYCHRKFLNTMKAKDRPSSDADDGGVTKDPGSIIIQKLASIATSFDEYPSFKVQRHALITARKFIFYSIHLGDCKHEFSEFIIPLLPLAFEALRVTLTAEIGEVDAADRMLEADVVKGFRYQIAEVSCSCQITYGSEDDLTRVLDAIDQVSKHETWQIRQAAANFLRCFQGGHKFVLTSSQTERTTDIVTRLLSDERKEVSAAAMAALTGILAAMPLASVTLLVKKNVTIANKSVIKRKKKKKASTDAAVTKSAEELAQAAKKEQGRAQRQQTSVFFLCASILARPYDTPPYVPEALAAISKHSFERSAPLTVRETVKMCCGEFKKTHMSDNWEVHKKQFTQEQLEALDDVVSTPHYYA